MESETALLSTCFSNFKWARSNGYIMLTSQLAPHTPHAEHTTRTHTHTHNTADYAECSAKPGNRITQHNRPHRIFPDTLIHIVIWRDGIVSSLSTFQQMWISLEREGTMDHITPPSTEKCFWIWHWLLCSFNIFLMFCESDVKSYGCLIFTCTLVSMLCVTTAFVYTSAGPLSLKSNGVCTFSITSCCTDCPLRTSLTQHHSAPLLSPFPLFPPSLHTHDHHPPPPPDVDSVIGSLFTVSLVELN